MKRLNIKKITLVSVFIGLAFILSGCTKTTSDANDNSFTAVEIVTGVADIKIKQNADKDLATAKAQELYRAAIYNGDDLSNGPCLSNKVLDGWVADIAHNPRQAVDDLPENQCLAYRAGTAKHFVELDLEGNLIRAE
ncbi:MAG: hypothetical protein Q8P20_02025 [bacterium]|nr:hypothetical protein [bacterium]